MYINVYLSIFINKMFIKTRVYDGSFLKPLSEADVGCYHNCTIKLTNVPELRYQDEDKIHLYNYEREYDVDLIFIYWFADWISLDEMTDAVETINLMKKVVSENKDIDQSSVTFREKEVEEPSTCLDYNYAVSFNFLKV